MSPLSKLLNRGSKPKAGQLYGAAVAQARRPVFYTNIGADDTPDGRLALISLHILLILERLSGPISGEAGGDDALSVDSLRPDGLAETSNSQDLALGRALMECFVEDLDAAMRELGIGDMGVPKRVKKAMAQFYDYARRYRAIRQDNKPDALPALLSDMIPGVVPESTGLQPLSGYVREVENALFKQTTEALAAGALALPDPDCILLNREHEAGTVARS